MGARTPGDYTTRRSADPSEKGKAAGVVIRWVHPSFGLTHVTDGHVLGRDVSCDTVLHDDEVSRRHARVQLRGLVPVISDLESRNGVHVNGTREPQAPIGPGDVLRIGSWVGVVLEEGPGETERFELREIRPGWYGAAATSAVAETVRRVAKTALPVVVLGETGTGKEGLARALHEWSERAGEFIAVDCGALAEQLAEGALFGYRKGAFTGAERAHDGYFRAANGGTLFLDEILNLPASLQAKLLRVLELGEVVPLGHSQPIRVDVRVVCAAQDSLHEAVAAGRFRADLLGRLDGLTAVLPPLRERREEIVPLFERLIASAAPGRALRMESRFVEALLLHDWPLNVRELVRLAQRIAALHDNEPLLRRSMLPADWSRKPASISPPLGAKKRSPADDPVEFERLRAALRDCDGNVSKAATLAGISRARAYRLIEAHSETSRTSENKPVTKP